jgi:hypothetical protein
VWPILAGKPAFIIDPFMFRIVTLNRPEIGRHLVARIDAAEFSLIVLQQDPLERRGRAWFDTVDLGLAVVDRIVANYQLESQPASDVFIFVPRR